VVSVQPNALRISCGRPSGRRKDALIEAPYDNRGRANAMVPYLTPPGSFMRGLGGATRAERKDAHAIGAGVSSVEGVPPALASCDDLRERDLLVRRCKEV
jgi:hypothetical protein